MCICIILYYFEPTKSPAHTIFTNFLKIHFGNINSIISIFIKCYTNFCAVL
jgi:hypothetical protein